jgi:hypothetical protein
MAALMKPLQCTELPVLADPGRPEATQGGQITAAYALGSGFTNGRISEGNSRNRCIQVAVLRLMLTRCSYSSRYDLDHFGTTSTAWVTRTGLPNVSARIHIREP